MHDQLQKAYQAQEPSPDPETSKVCSAHMCTLQSWWCLLLMSTKSRQCNAAPNHLEIPLQPHVSIQLPCQLDDSSLASCDAAPATPDVEQRHPHLQTSPSQQSAFQVDASGRSATSTAASGSGFSRGQHFNPEHDAILRVECLSARRLKVGAQAALHGCHWNCQQQAAALALLSRVVSLCRAAGGCPTATLVSAML